MAMPDSRAVEAAYSCLTLAVHHADWVLITAGGFALVVALDPGDVPTLADVRQSPAAQSLASAIGRLAANYEELTREHGAILAIARKPHGVHDPIATWGDKPVSSWYSTAMDAIQGLLWPFTRGNSLGAPTSKRTAEEWEAIAAANIEADPSAAALTSPPLPFTHEDLVTLRERLERECRALIDAAGEPVDAKAPALRAGDDQSAGPALTADHESILAVLGKSPTKCKTVGDVARAGTIRNRETVGRLLSQLAECGMVNRPYGTRNGYALTDAGRERLRDATPT